MNALLSCLCKIHNFCIDNGNATPPERYEHDVLTLMDFVNINDGDGPHSIGLFGGGEHFAMSLKDDEEPIIVHKDWYHDE